MASRKRRGRGAELVVEIPPEVVVDILSRLPVKSVFICRRVCKLWLSLISGSDFARLHLSRSPQVSILVKHHFKQRHREGNPLLLDSKFGPDGRMTFTPQTNLPRNKLKIVNSCNGLLCLCNQRQNTLYVCNPILGEYITLPKCHPGRVCYRNFAFGFSPATREYKVVRSITSDSDSRRTVHLQIYTLGEEGSWRSLGLAPHPIGNFSFNTLLNGAFHWLACTTKMGPNTICCFDFVTEQFRAIPEPFESILLDMDYDWLTSGIGVLQECLCISSKVKAANCRFAMSLMKDYGVKESWTKHLVIENHSEFLPLMVLASGQVLHWVISGTYSTTGLLLYDPETGESRRVPIDGVDRVGDVFSHIPSFVSLRDVAKGENFKMCRDG